MTDHAYAGPGGNGGVFGLDSAHYLGQASGDAGAVKVEAISGLIPTSNPFDVGYLQLGLYVEKRINPGNTLSGALEGLAGWRDTIYVSSSQNAPSQLLLTFSVEGEITVDGQGDLTGWAETYWHAGNSHYANHSASSHHSATAGSFLPRAQFSILGDVRWDDPLIPQGWGGFHVIAYLRGWLDGQGVIDTMHTMTLASVTLADGSPLPGDVSYHFQSGMVPMSVVPEPSSLVMGSIATLLGIGYAYRRRTKVGRDYRSAPRSRDFA
jgi:hypothetical protein